MNFILVVKCTEEQDFTYSNPFYTRIKNGNPSCDSLDLDNFSEQALIEHACTAIGLADKACIVFVLEPGADTSPFIKLATLIADHPEKYRVFITGTDGRLSKLLFEETNFSYHNLTETDQLEFIKKFFTEK